jgi:sarcosine oxidase, subunit gamma
MTTLPRRSFVYRRVAEANVSFVARDGAGFGETSEPASLASGLKLVDLSVLPRWGLKGRGIASWLARHGMTMPVADNRAERQQDGSLLARLAPAEVLILAPLIGKSVLAGPIERMAPGGEDACYGAPRRESHCWFVVIGSDAAKMFAKLCGVDLSSGRFAIGQIAQTSVARLNAIVIRQDLGGVLAFFLLAESASAEYLWDCLLDAMAEFAGAACGADAILDLVRLPRTSIAR